MVSQEIKQKIKYIQIRTRRILSGILIGDCSTAIKGTGLEFDQIREYHLGDDVRFVDWKNSAKMGQLLVKQYFEEREKNIIIVLDVSSSSFFSSKYVDKYNIMSQIACILISICEYSKDKVALLMFSDKVIEFVPFNSGTLHSANLFRKIFDQNLEEKKTNINLMLEYLNKNLKKKSIIFIISDFIDENDFEKNLKIISKKNEVISIRCLDEYEKNLPELGIIHLRDFETKKEMIIDARKKSKNQINFAINNMILHQNNLFKKLKVKLLDINNHRDYFSDLVSFFRKQII